MSQIKELQYFLNTKKSVLVASIVGGLTSANQGLLKNCLDEIQANKQLKFVVLNLQGVQAIEESALRNFTKMQSILREDYTLILCALSEDLRKTLLTSGVIRETELQKDLLSALQNVLKQESGK